MTRFFGLVGVGARRVAARLTGPHARRTWFSISGVAVAIALMLVVTGVGLGLAAQTTVQSDAVDYWIVPESGSSTPVVSTGGTQFGHVHSATERITADERVTYATPVLMELLRVRGPNGDDPEYVLALGVIPSERADDVAGISTAGLTPGDPYYGSGSYDGEWTGQVVLSSAAAEVLNASTDDRLSVFTTRPVEPISVANVSEGDVGTGMGQLPVVLFHLSELQTIAGSDSGDRANQILVGTNSPAVEDDLQGLYPRSQVVTRTGLATGGGSDADLSLAIGATALIVAIVIGTLFVATTMGLEVVADRRHLAVLAAIGFRRRDQALLTVVQTLCVTVLGGLIGIVLGIGGIILTNRLASEYISVADVALFHPVLAGYGLLVALAIGVLAAPYLLALTYRTTTLEELSDA